MEKDIDVRDVLEEDDQIIVYGEVSDFHNIQEALKEKGITEFSIAEIQMIAQNEVTLTGEDLKNLKNSSIH
jgi:transcriptional/translational regulatory protein YebC/TACO1